MRIIKTHISNSFTNQVTSVWFVHSYELIRSKSTADFFSLSLFYVECEYNGQLWQHFRLNAHIGSMEPKKKMAHSSPFVHLSFEPGHTNDESEKKLHVNLVFNFHSCFDRLLGRKWKRTDGKRWRWTFFGQANWIMARNAFHGSAEVIIAFRVHSQMNTANHVTEEFFF